MANQFEPYVDLQVAAEYLDVSTRTIRRMITSQEIPARRVGGPRGAIRLRLSEIDAALFHIGKAV